MMWWHAGGNGNGQSVLLGLARHDRRPQGLFGVLVPLTLQRFGADPCTASSIFLTTGTDIASIGLHAGMATVLVL